MKEHQNFFEIKWGNRGFSLVEALVMMFVATVCIFVVWRVYTLFIKISLSNPSLFQASFLAEEGIEAVKFMRDSNWTVYIAPLTSDTPYTLVFDGSSWEATTTITLIDGKFDRRIYLSDVYRDASGDIASAGSLDPNTKKILSIVSWQQDSATSSRQITTYVNNIFEN